MGPKKAFTAEEAEEIKRSLDFLSEEVAAMRKQQRDILDLAGEIKVLRLQSKEKSDLEQYTRINNVIVTGLHVKPRSYARAVTDDNGGEPGERDGSSTEQQVAAFLQTKGIELRCSDIEACHPLPRRKTSDIPVVIIRMARNLKKQGKIQNTWTANCKIFIKLNGSPEAKAMVIRDIAELDKFQ
ncbi:unnamed protein product [Boreogadus saida]